jgi:DNA polymerase-3 subunit delta'
LHLREGAGEVRNADIHAELNDLARRVGFEWLRSAVARTDALIQLLRRNVQKSIALDSLVVELRAVAS